MNREELFSKLNEFKGLKGDSLLRETALWAVDFVDEYRYRPLPTTPETILEAKRKGIPISGKLLEAHALWFKTYREIIATNASNYYWLKKWSSVLDNHPATKNRFLRMASEHKAKSAMDGIDISRIDGELWRENWHATTGQNSTQQTNYSQKSSGREKTGANDVDEEEIYNAVTSLAGVPRGQDT